MDFIIEKVNLLSHPINLNYKNKNYFNSIFGACLSLLFYAMFIYCTFYFSSDFIYGLNPKVNYKQSQVNPNLNKNLSHLVKFIRVQGEAECRTKIANLSGLNTTEFKKKIPEFALVVLNIYNKTDAFIYSNEDFEIENIKEDVSSTKGTYLYRIEYSLIINSTSVFTGFDDKQIKLSDYLFNVKNTDKINFIVMLSISPRVNFKSLHYSFKSELYQNYLNDEDHYYSSDSTKIILFDDKRIYHMYFGISEIIEDYGWIFSKFMYKYFLEIKSFFFASLDTVYSKDDINFEYLGHIRISFEKSMSTHIRVYKKLQNVLADLGGLFSAFLVVGNLIVSEFNKKKFNLELINELYCADLNVLEKESDQSSGKNKVLISSKFRNFTAKFIDNLAKNHSAKSVIVEENRNNIGGSGLRTKERVNTLPVNYHNSVHPKRTTKNIELNRKEKSFKNNNNYNENNLDPNLRLRPNDFDQSKNLSEIRLKCNYSYKELDSSDLRINNQFQLKDDEAIENSANPKLKGSLDSPENKSKKISDEMKAKIIENEPEYTLIKRKIESMTSADQKVKKAKFLNYSSTEIFKSLIFLEKCKSDEIKSKDRLYKLAEQRIYRFLDVLHIIKLTEMFGILKKILFNEKQNLCFDYFKIVFEPKINKTQEQIQNDLLEIFKYFNSRENESKLESESRDFSNLNIIMEQNRKIKSLLDRQIYQLLQNAD